MLSHDQIYFEQLRSSAIFRWTNWAIFAVATFCRTRTARSLTIINVPQRGVRRTWIKNAMPRIYTSHRKLYNSSSLWWRRNYGNKLKLNLRHEEALETKTRGRVGGERNFCSRDPEQPANYHCSLELCAVAYEHRWISGKPNAPEAENPRVFRIIISLYPHAFSNDVKRATCMHLWKM